MKSIQLFIITLCVFCIFGGCRTRTFKRDYNHLLNQIENNRLDYEKETNILEKITSSINYQYKIKIKEWSKPDSTGNQYLKSEKSISGEVLTKTEKAQQREENTAIQANQNINTVETINEVVGKEIKQPFGLKLACLTTVTLILLFFIFKLVKKYL